jgi:transcriptional regulator with GAF, ATPase, and Fis domain
VDVRVIAATNRPLPELVRAGGFRADLFYRLNVFPLTLPPLRERSEDIAALVWAFVREFSFKMGKPIDSVRQADLDALARHPWPGNVRELRNVVERAMILASGPELRLEPPDPDGLGGQGPPGSRRLRDVEQAHIRQVLASTGGRIRGKGGAAEILDVKPTTLYSLMHRLGVERPRR